MSRPFFFLPAVLVLSSSLGAQIPDTGSPGSVASGETSPLGLSPDDASLLLGQLQRLQDDFSNNRNTLLTSAKTRILAATASESTAAELYLAAYKIVNIDHDATAAAAGNEWRESQIEWLKETGAPKAIRIQLAWLSLLIEAAQTDEEKRASLLPKARSITQEAVAVAAQLTVLPESSGADRRGGPGGGPGGGGPGKGRDRPGGRGERDAGQFLTQSVLSSLFAQAYNLRNHIDPPSNWAMAPLDLDAVYGRMLIPNARAQQPKDMAVLWDERIKNEASLRRANLSEAEFAEWGQSQGRDLLWQKNLDLLRSGVGGRAAGEELLRLFKENPTHGSIGSWKRDLDQITSAISKG